MDKEELKASIITNSWVERERVLDLDEEIAELDNIMEKSCDAVMGRVCSLPDRKRVYWWSNEIAQLRGACCDRRRVLGRCRRRKGRDSREVEKMLTAYKNARRALRTAIRKAKGEESAAGDSR